MQPELLLPVTVAVAALTTWLATPLAIRLAVATGFLDRPAGYKGHGRATPYLGGTAIFAGVVVAGLAFGDASGRFAVLGACVMAIFVLGTIDDRLNLSPAMRLVFEIAIAVVLAATGNGWEVFGVGILDALITIAWVVGVVNAVNLMDNMDGAAATVVGIAAAATGTVAALAGDPTAAAMCLAVAGACAGFLPYNLAHPARIFMGDGGSMTLGLLLAGLSMTIVSKGGLGAAGVVEAALIAGLVILDTTLVTISRRRAGRPLLSGGRDHLTHRLKSRLGSARAVAAVLGGTQVVVCAVAVVTGQLNVGAVVIAGSLAVLAALWAIRELERIPVVVAPTPTHVPVLALAPGFEAAPFDSPAAAVFGEPEPAPEPALERLHVSPAAEPLAALALAETRAEHAAHRFARRRTREEATDGPVRRFARRQVETDEAVAPAGNG